MIKKISAIIITVLALSAALVLSAFAAEITLNVTDGVARASVSGSFDGEASVVICAYTENGRFSDARVFRGDCAALKAENMALSVPANGEAKLFVLDESFIPAELFDGVEFTVQPASQTVTDKASRLTAEANERDGVSYTYQWYENGQALSGETSKVLELAPRHKEEEKTYYCRVTADNGKKVSAAVSDSAAVAYRKNEINLVWFGGCPVGSFRVTGTVAKMLEERYGVPVKTAGTNLTHTTTYNTYNVYEAFTSDTASSVDNIEFKSTSLENALKAPGVDYVIIQVGRDYSLYASTSKTKETASFRKIARVLFDYNPDAKIILYAPYGHTVGFEEDFKSRTDIRSHAEQVDVIMSRANVVKNAIVNDGYITDVTIAPAGPAFEEFAQGDADLLKNALFRPERWSAEGNEDKSTTMGYNLANRASAPGAYLAASTIYAAITGESPVGLTTPGSRYYFIDSDVGSFFESETVRVREYLGQTGDELRLSLQKAAHRTFFGNESYPDASPARTFTQEISGEYTERKPENDGYFLNTTEGKDRYYSANSYLFDGKLRKAGETVRIKGAASIDGVAYKDSFVMPAKDVATDEYTDGAITAAVREDASLGSDLLLCGDSLSGTLTYKVKYNGVSQTEIAYRYGHFLPLNVTLPSSGTLTVTAGKGYTKTLTGKSFELILPIDEKRSDIVLNCGSVTRAIKTAGLTLTPRPGLPELRTMAFALYDRNIRFQYDQLNMDRASRTNYRSNRGVLPEYATMQRFGYLDCAVYVKTVYIDTFNYAFNDGSNVSRMIDYEPGRLFYYQITGNETQEEKDAILETYRNMLEPGDTMQYRYSDDISTGTEANGHVMLYIGDGMFLHSTTSQGDYNYDLRRDAEEPEGTIRYESVDKLFDPNDSRYLFYNNGTKAKTRFSLTRALDLIDVDASLTDAARIRHESLSDIFIERVSSHATGRGFGPGEEVTVTTFIENRGAREKTLFVSNSLSSGLVFAGGDAQPGNVTVKAGEKKTLIFKVKASEDAAEGDTLTVSGTVNGYPVNDVLLYCCNTVSDPDAFRNISAADLTANDENDMIRKIYAAAGYEDVAIPDSGDAAQTFFPASAVSYSKTFKRYCAKVTSFEGGGAWELLVPGIIGGSQVSLTGDLYPMRIRKLTEHQLIPGDVLLTCDLLNGDGASDTCYYVYLGDQRFAYMEGGAVKETVASGIAHPSSDSAYLISDLLASVNGRPAFALLRPSQGFESGSGGSADDLTGEWNDQ
ncbi:MAG: hypothetical protein IJS65_05075 [Clostridia bacterium]|nr:hypothetical protein [Clostridia bacterium]